MQRSEVAHKASIQNIFLWKREPKRKIDKQEISYRVDAIFFPFCTHIGLSVYLLLRSCGGQMAIFGFEILIFSPTTFVPFSY
jgi:hypothetical protein